MGIRELGTTQGNALSATSKVDLLQVARGEFDRYHRLAEAARGDLREWRARLRVTTYTLYRFLGEDDRRRHRLLVELRIAGERPAQLIAEEIEAFAGLIDEGRALPSAPPSLTRATAEAVGGAVFHELYLVTARRGPLPAEGALIPLLLYSVVLPYLGADAASEELRTPPPPEIVCSGGEETGRSAGRSTR